MELFVQLYFECFETIQVVRLWSEDVHIFGHNPQYIIVTFLQNELSHYFVQNLRDTRYLAYASPPAVLY